MSYFVTIKKLNTVGLLMVSSGDKPWERKVEIGSWERGEKYIADIIEVREHES